MDARPLAFAVRVVAADLRPAVGLGDAEIRLTRQLVAIAAAESWTDGNAVHLKQEVRELRRANDHLGPTRR